MRLIDRAELFNALSSENTDDYKYRAKVYSIIGDLKAVDAVPVVRCKDCIHFVPEMSIGGRYTYGSHCGRFLNVITEGFRNGERSIDKTSLWCGKNDFCSFAERKTE